MPLWVVVLVILLSPVVVGLSIGLVLAAKLMRWKLPAAITHLHVGEHEVMLVKVTIDVTAEQLATTLKHVQDLFHRNGVDIPILIVAPGLDFSVAGANVADARQKVPA